MDETDRWKFLTWGLAILLAILSICLALGDMAFMWLGGYNDARVSYLFSYLENYGGIIGRLILSMLFLLMPIAGLVLGKISLNRTNCYQALFPVRPWAIMGISLSILLACPVILAGVFIPHSSCHANSETTCVNNQRMIALYIMIYAEDHDHYCPKSLTELKPYLEDDPHMKRFKCPDSVKKIGYGYNRFAVGMPIKDINNPTAFLLTADGGDTLHLLNSREDIDDRRHKLESAVFNWRFRAPRGFISAYADGHVSLRKSGTPVQLQPR